MKWKRLGKIFEPPAGHEWMHTHASVPVAEHLSDSLYRIYFSTRDKENRSQLGWVVLDINDPFNILEVAKEPILQPGAIGTFDDSGVMATAVLDVADKKYLYYVGFNLGVTVPFRNSIGLAISNDGGKTFQKFSEGPIIDRNYKEPHFTASICVMLEATLFRAWYLSCSHWKMVDGKPKHYYHIKYAESHNGIDWIRNGKVAIDFKDEHEYAISVPRVIKENGIYKMWFSCRGDKYTIGYAESNDGINWLRKDETLGLKASGLGWDSEMVEYPCVFDHNNHRYMLYNGNQYGKTGFGLAVLEA